MTRFVLRRSAEVAVTADAPWAPVAAAGVPTEHLHQLPSLLPGLHPSLLPGLSPGLHPSLSPDPDPSELPSAPISRSAARRELGWPADRFTVVHLAPMTHRQDVTTVIEAARWLAEASAAMDVVLAGDAVHCTALQHQAFGVDNLRFVARPAGTGGAFTTDPAGLVLAAADVLLVTDRGGAAVEPLATCLAAGRPVLVVTGRDTAAAHELRRTGAAGRRVEPGDPVALAEELTALAASPAARAAMARSGLRYARAHLGLPAVLRRLELVVDAALAGRSEGVGR